MISRNCIVYCLITDCYYKPNDTIINTSNFQFRVFIICMTTALCFLFFIKSPIILPLCSSKIAWDKYAPLQMISEYFPASDSNMPQAAILNLKAARPWELVLWPMRQRCEIRGWFQRSNDYSKTGQRYCKSEEMMFKSNNIWIFWLWEQL